MVECNIANVEARVRFPYSAPKIFVPETREPIIVENLCFLLLACGKVTVLDVQDYHLVSGKKWFVVSSDKEKSGYAAYRKNNKKIRLHNLIMNPDDGFYVDHINGNTLDNRRINLRIVTIKQNGFNRSGKKKSTSKYKGVYFYKSRNKWRSLIEKDSKSYHLGYFDDEKSAALAYDSKAKEFFGEYARLNFTN